MKNIKFIKPYLPQSLHVLQHAIADITYSYVYVIANDHVLLQPHPPLVPPFIRYRLYIATYLLYNVRAFTITTSDGKKGLVHIRV